MGTELAAQLLASSIVILLANPAHGTALNARKRLIEGRLHSPSIELAIFSALITGSRECANQSLFWHHRQWIFKRMSPSSGQRFDHDGNRFSDLSLPEDSAGVPTDTLENEITLVAKSCEIYQRNYHAWAHLHFCFEIIYSSLQYGSEQESSGYFRIIEDEYRRLMKWIERHISDYSAVHQLCNLVRRFKGLCEFMDYASLFDHSISLVTVYPQHETLWMYVRLVVGAIDLKAKQDCILRISSLPVSSSQQRCIFWCNLD